MTPNPPPPLALFRKFIRFGSATLPLMKFQNSPPPKKKQEQHIGQLKEKRVFQDLLESGCVDLTPSI